MFGVLTGCVASYLAMAGAAYGRLAAGEHLNKVHLMQHLSYVNIGGIVGYILQMQGVKEPVRPAFSTDICSDGRRRQR